MAEEAPQNKFLEDVIEKTAEIESSFIVANAKIEHHPIIYCSQPFAYEIGFTRHEITKKDVYCSFLYGRQTKTETKRKLEKAVTNKTREQLEIILYNKADIKKWYLITLIPVKETNGVTGLFLMLFNNITHLKGPLIDSPRRQWRTAVRKILRKPSLGDLRKSIDDKRNHKKKKMWDMETIRRQAEEMFISEYGIKGIKVPKFLINHTNPYKVAWDMIVLLCILYTSILVPFIISFDHKDVVIAAFDTIVDIIFITDIVLTFFTTYVTANGKLVTNAKQIRLTYLKGWFLLDFVAALPYSSVGFLFPEESEIMIVLSGMKGVRLLRIGKVGKKIERHMHNPGVTLGVWISIFCLCAHWMACVWYAIGKYIDEPGKTHHSWLAILADVTNSPYNVTTDGSIVQGTGPTLASLYVSALYYTMSSLTTCGFGNIAPNTSAEKVFGCFTMLFGCVLYALIFGQVTNIISQFQKNSNLYTEQLNTIRRFNSLYKMPIEVAKKVENYFTATWAATKGTKEEEVLNACPRDLQSDLCLRIHSKVLEGNNPAFSHLSKTSLRAISRYFGTIRTAPGDKLIYQGEIVDKIYFVATGSLEVKRGNDLVGLIGPGDAFGKRLSTDERGQRSIFTVEACSFAAIHFITCDSIQEALELYPDQYENIKYDLVLSFDITRQVKSAIHVNKDNENDARRQKKIFEKKDSFLQFQNSVNVFVPGEHVTEIENIPNIDVLAGMIELQDELRRETERMNSKMEIVEAEMRLILTLICKNKNLDKDEDIKERLNDLLAQREIDADVSNTNGSRNDIILAPVLEVDLRSNAAQELDKNVHMSDMHDAMVLSIKRRPLTKRRTSLKDFVLAQNVEPSHSVNVYLDDVAQDVVDTVYL